jgi:ubiquitin C-terminal hydrolase
MSIPKRVKDLGLVVDGRIRKGWPFRRFGGLRTPETSRSKGLLNPGVLCYRNAVLQCLLHNSEFFRYLSRQDRCATPGDNCVFCALRGLTIEYWTNTDSAARQQALDNVNTAMENHQQPGTTYGFLRRAGKKVNDMSISGQQDAHEYFLGLTNMLRHIKNDMNHGYNIR